MYVELAMSINFILISLSKFISFKTLIIVRIISLLQYPSVFNFNTLFIISIIGFVLQSSNNDIISNFDGTSQIL